MAIIKLTNTNAAATQALKYDNSVGYFDEVPDILTGFAKDVRGCKSVADVAAMLEAAKTELGKLNFEDGSTPQSAAKADKLGSWLTLGTGTGPFSEIDRNLCGDLLKGLTLIAKQRITELNTAPVDAFIYSVE